MRLLVLSAGLCVFGLAASPAAANPISLICPIGNNGQSLLLQIDYSSGTVVVTTLDRAGNVFAGPSDPAPATITDDRVVALWRYRTNWQRVTLNRYSGIALSEIQFYSQGGPSGATYTERCQPYQRGRRLY